MAPELYHTASKQSVNALEAVNLSKSFGDKVAANQITLTVRQGATHALVGRNGAGKTTTIRMITGIIMPDEGSIHVLGQSPKKRRGQIGYLPEERGLYADMTAQAMAAYMGELRLVKKHEAIRRAKERLRAWDIDPSMKIGKLSKGMAQAVQIVGATLHDPVIMILDEPFSGLDPVAQIKLEQWIAERRQQGLTTIVSTHNMQQAERLCESLTLIDQGQVRYSGTMNDARSLMPGKGYVKITGLESDIEKALVASQRISIDEWTFPVRSQAEGLINRLASVGKVIDYRVDKASLQDVFVEMVGARG